jgi:hypothetical protein
MLLALGGMLSPRINIAMLLALGGMLSRPMLILVSAKV